jgi:hypothetical protein
MREILLFLLLTFLVVSPTLARAGEVSMKEKWEENGQMMGPCSSDDVVVMMGMCIQETTMH